jgi:VanZ family protein
MIAIFIASATPAAEIPQFGILDGAVKKGGHFLAYGLLALAYRRGLGWEKPRLPAAWLLAVTYALLDEFHQSFVPGRHPSLIDALLFDGGGALTALVLSTQLWHHRREIAPGDAQDATNDASKADGK